MNYYTLKFSEKAKNQYDVLDKSIKIKCDKKLLQLSHQNKKRRHLKFGESFFVEEVGQYRIIYEIIDTEIVILILFIGKHKEYDNFLWKVKEIIEEYEKSRNLE